MKIICIDFDGTVVRHEYPAIGEEVPGATSTLKYFIDRGYRLILWTMRSGAELQDAADWFADRGIELFSINTNPDQHTWTDSPKAYAQIYIDDAALGCPLTLAADSERPYVDWEVIRKLFNEQEGISDEMDESAEFRGFR